MSVKFKPEGGAGVHYNPEDSIIHLFPAAVKIAAYNITAPEAEGYRELLYSRGATWEGLMEAIAFYERYFQCLLDHKAKDQAFDTFVDCGMPFDNISFMLFQSNVAAALVSLYHDDQVEFGGMEVEWRESFLKNALEYLATLSRLNKTE